MTLKKLRPNILIIFGLYFINIQAQTVTDIDGNVYKTVKIGSQEWMAENLKTTKFNDGKPIPLISDNYMWNFLTDPRFCWYNNDSISNKKNYGGLYNWYTVNTDKLCPVGWHVPTDAEWITLFTYLRGEQVAGGRLKEKDITHWKAPNKGATDVISFSALPGGYRIVDGYFSQLGLMAYWWTKTEENEYDAVSRSIAFDEMDVKKDISDKRDGFSVRCVKN